jgi:hypothetical protein
MDLSRSIEGEKLKGLSSRGNYRESLLLQIRVQKQRISSRAGCTSPLDVYGMLVSSAGLPGSHVLCVTLLDNQMILVKYYPRSTSDGSVVCPPESFLV